MPGKLGIPGAADDALVIPRLAGSAVSAMFAGKPLNAGLLPGPLGLRMGDALLDPMGPAAVTAATVAGSQVVVRWQTLHEAVVEG